MRGLKQELRRLYPNCIVSHLLQMRGLKRLNPEVLTFRFVASFTDAWIETHWLINADLKIKSHLLQMRGLKLPFNTITVLRHCRIFYRCVDWNTKGLPPFLEGICRIFYRCVDWNYNMQGALADTLGRIFYRCVDWNCIFAYCMRPFGVASFTDAWIETWNKQKDLP